MPSLGNFMFLAFLGPGIVVLSALLILWPELRTLVLQSDQNAQILIFLSFLLSFMSGHLPLFFQVNLFEKIWKTTHRAFNLNRDESIMSRRTKILIEADAQDINHKYIDQILGEFILFFNSAFWILFISIPRLILWPDHPLDIFTIICIIVSLFCIFYTCPIYLNNYYISLSTLEKKLK